MDAANAEPVAAALRRSRDDPEAFRSFYAAHADPLLGYFMRRIGDVELALELMAETLARAYLGRRRFRGSTDAEAAGWIYAIADRELASYFRKQEVERRALKRLGLERPRPSDEAEARMIERETLEEIHLALTSTLHELSVEQRQAVELRFIEELQYAEIADRLDISEQAARARVARGLRTLREHVRAQPTLMEEAL